MRDDMLGVVVEGACDRWFGRPLDRNPYSPASAAAAIRVELDRARDDLPEAAYRSLLVEIRAHVETELRTLPRPRPRAYSW